MRLGRRRRTPSHSWRSQASDGVRRRPALGSEPASRRRHRPLARGGVGRANSLLSERIHGRPGGVRSSPHGRHRMPATNLIHHPVAADLDFDLDPGWFRTKQPDDPPRGAIGNLSRHPLSEFLSTPGNRTNQTLAAEPVARSLHQGPASSIPARSCRAQSLGLPGGVWRGRRCALSRCPRALPGNRRFPRPGHNGS